MRTPFKFGNLFVTFEVEFPLPNSLSPESTQELLNLLPGDNMEIDPTAEKHISIAFDKTQVTENNSKIHSDYNEEEEDEDPRFAGAQRVNCANSIF